jgi:hypothetical protein
MKNTIKWGLPLLFLSIMVSCSFFKTSEQPSKEGGDSIPKDTLTQVIEPDSLSEVQNDSVSGQ